MPLHAADQIDPAAHRGLLQGLNLPYSVHTARPFTIVEHLREIVCEYSRVKNAPATVVERRDQLMHWRACVASAGRLDDEEGRRGAARLDNGWTLGLASPSSFQYSEAVAAQLCAHYLAARRVVLWLNITSGWGGEKELRKLTPYTPDQIDALVVTGIRWEGDAIRFDKAFDILRQTRPHTDRIIVGSGTDPLSITRAMDLSVHRALFVTESKLVNM